VAVAESGFGDGDRLDAGVEEVRCVVVDDGAAGKAALGVGTAGSGGERYRKALPVHHVGANGVDPVHVSPDGGMRVVLMKHVVLAAPVDGAAGVVHPAAGWLEVEGRAVRIIEGMFRLLRGGSEGVFQRMNQCACSGECEGAK